MQPRNVVERLMRLAETKAERIALRLLGDGKNVTEQLSFAELDGRARKVAARLQQASVKPGERALLLFPTGLAYVEGFLGCLYAGVIAVPAYPPESAQPQQLARLSSLLLDATPKIVLTEAQYLEPLRAFLGLMGGGELAVLATDALEGANAADFVAPEYATDGLAFLQYTSGSTAAPKGVMVGHDNLAANEEVIREAFAISEADTIVTWLPLYHDMGLIGGLLQPLFSGASLVLMSPRHFLERPARWLEAISRFGGTVSGAPDFAYRLCAERVPDDVLAELDLTSWRVAFSGSEPIREATLSAFVERFESAGFERRALYPCYGLAEATLFVTGAKPGAGFEAARFAEESLATREVRRSPSGVSLVSSGSVRAEHAVAIVDPETLAPAEPGKLGEIWIRGPSVTHGYWNNPSATQATFPERDGQRWLRSGDLGFVDGDQLYVSGRLKDMIIVRGQNLYPQDIERTIEEELEFVRKGRVAAFALEEEGVETLGVAAEISRSAQKLVQPEALAQAVCDAVARAHHEPPRVVLLLNPGGLPKTSSGKLRRSVIRAAWQAGELDVLSVYRKGRLEAEPSAGKAPAEHESELEARVRAIWKDVLGVPEVLASDSFFALGGNSLAAVQVVTRIEQELGRRVRAAAIWQCPVLRAFVAELSTSAAPAMPGPIPSRGEGSQLAPLSFSQQRFWLLAALRPDSAAYNVQAAVAVRGEFAEGALVRAVRALVGRHAALRTLFHVSDDGQSVQQRTQPELAPVIRELPAATPEAELRAEAERDVLASFDLSRGPLLRVILAERSERERVVVFTLPHIATDGFSMQILFGELLALASAGESAVSPVPFSYADYASWQRSAEPAEIAARLAALREQWPANLGSVELPADRARRGLPTQIGGSVRFALPDASAKRLAELCRAQGVTSFSVLLAALAALVYRYTAAPQFALGVPVANRLQPGAERVVGPFVNTAVVHCRVAGGESFLELVARVQAEGQRVQQDQDLPFEQVVDVLGVERTAAPSPLFQVMYNHQRTDLGARVAGYELELLDFDSPCTPFDLVLDTYDDGTGAIRARFGYAVDLFERATIERFQRQFLELLARLLAAPHCPLGEIGLFSEAELAALCARAPAEVSAVELVPAAFRRVAALRGERQAVVGGTSRKSYGELECTARSIAFALERLGVGPETRVAIAAARTPLAIAGMLAVWKAGGAYVPLDPAYPLERLRYMLRDAGVGVVLFDRAAGAALDLPGDVRRVCLEDCLGGAEIALEASPDSEQLAYVIYTSGSTGEPKGVAVSHGALAMHCAAAAALYEMSDTDRALHFASMSFDAAVEQWVVPLIHGGGLVLSQGLWTGAETADVVRREGVTVVYPPTSQVTELARVAAEGSMKLGVRVCTVGGEAVSRESVEVIRRGLAPEFLVNGYGPTEAVVTPLLWRAASSAVFDTTFAPIGNVVGDRSAWVLDRDLQPLPRGAVGELYLGGAGLARGYHARPALTAERFVPDPFSVRAGGRLYRTGDLARELVDGSFEFVGRTDRQVKIRGYRVELEEIEAALLADDDVREAAVLLGEPARLVGYLVLGAANAELDAVRERLLARVPSHMVPAQFVVLAAMPRTPNGKLDREALPAPEALELSAVAPETVLQAKLLRVFQATLGNAGLGIHDNFFAAGGDSILSIQLAGAARKVGLQFSPRQLFEHQTVAGLARVLEQGSSQELEAQFSCRDVPLLPAQLDFFERVHTARHRFNQAMLLELSAPLDAAHLERAISQLVEQHDALRLRFELSGEVVRQSYAQSVDAARGVLWVRDILSADQREQVLALAQRSFELERGPLFRIVLLRHGSGSSELFLVFHHLLVDGVSLRILVEDLEALLLDDDGDAKPGLAAKTASLQAWGAGLARLAGSDAVEAEVTRLEAEVASHTPTSLTRGELPARATRSRIDSTATARLLGTARSRRLALQDVLLSAVSTALTELTGNAANLLEVEGHGREDGEVLLDVSRTVGWFTSIAPVVMVSDRTLLGTLNAVRAATAGLARRGLLLGLARYLSTAALGSRLRSLPSPTLAFNYLGNLDRGLEGSRLFRLVSGTIAESIDPQQPLRCPLVLDAFILDGALELSLRFESGSVSETAGQRFLRVLESSLGELVEELRATPLRLSPRDFPDVALTQEELDALPFTPSQVEAIEHLSPAQEGILFHGLEAGAADPYAFQRGFALEGDWELERLERAWHVVASRHDALRSSYFWERAGRPIRVTLCAAELAWSSEDLSDASEEQAHRRLAAWLAADSARPFDFSGAARLRFHCIRRSAKLAWLIWSHHHVALDGWSLSLVVSEVLRAYERTDSEPAADARGPGPSQRARATASSLETSEYFRRRLAGFDAATEIATLAPESGAEGYAESSLELDAGASRELGTRARQAGITLNTAIQAAFALALCRRAGVDDVVFGVTLSGRSPSAREAVGLFINTLPMRVRAPGAERVRDWLFALQADGAELREHETASLSEVLRASEIPDGRGLFDSILVVENYPIEAALLAQPATRRLRLLEDALPPTVLSVARGRNNYAVSLIVTFHDAISLRLSHRLDRLARVDAERLLTQVRDLLDALLAEPTRRVGELGLCSQERAASLSTPGSQPGFLPIVEAFRRAARENSAEISLTCGDSRLTYSELDAWSDRVAAALLRSGVRAEQRVPIVLERSLEFVVALLGVLKAGGAYVPLDPELPRERLLERFRDSSASLVLTSRQGVSLESVPGVELCFVEELREGEVANLDVRPIQPEQAAYVIYTSGSTGAPKGVVVSHRALANYVAGLVERLASPRTSMAMASTVSADLGHTVLFGALGSQRTLHLIPAQHSFDADAFAASMHRYRPDVLKIVPSHLAGLLQGSQPEQVLPESTLILGGEAASPELLRRIRALKPELRILNHYGPTETTIGVLTHELQGDDISATLPLGRPLAGTRVYLLDSELNPVPEGIPAELYVGGVGVARGYEGRPGASAERFLPDPLCPGERMYRTGDRALLRHGVVEFLGRRDEQVKIRGNRVELGEVAAALRDVAGVAEAVVVAELAEASGRLELLGYYVVAPGYELTPAALRAALEQRLPSYMVPTLVAIGSVPLTANGKIDKPRLPRPRLEARAHAAPRNELERALVEIWQSVLRLERVGIHEHFLELGGDSILSLQVIARAKRRQIRISPKLIFERPTIAELAAALAAASETSEISPIPVADRTQPIPLTSLQERLWFLSELAPASRAYTVAGALRLRGETDPGALERALRGLMARHEVLRTRFVERDGRLEQKLDGAAALPFTNVDLRHAGGGPSAPELDAEFEAALDAPFELAKGQLIRAWLFRTDDSEHVLLLSAHHALLDGWSMNVLIEEFSALYAAELAGTEPELPALSLQFADYACFEKQRSGSEAARAELERCVAELGPVPAPLELPFDRVPAESPSMAGNELAHEFAPELVAALRRFAESERATPFMVLLAAFAALLYRYSGERSLWIGVPNANRSRPETQALVGPLVNTQVFKLDVDPRASFAALVAHVKAVTLQAQTHAELPFERLVERLRPQRNLQHSPLFQVMFNHQKRSLSGLRRLPGVEVSRCEVRRRTAQLDLMLSTEEDDLGGFAGSWGYASEHFDTATIEALSGAFQRVLAAVLDEPAMPIGGFALLGPSEIERLHAWNASACDFEQGLVTDWLASAMRRRPEAMALRFRDQALTYAELEQRVGGLAARLRREGVGPDVVVGIALERSFELVVAILAVLQAGGAFLPLDPEYPEERLRLMIRDSGTRLVLSTAALVSRVGAEPGARVLDLTALASESAKEPASLVRAVLRPQNLAYVLFTSGSTGRPKGAAIPHAGLANRLAWMQKAYGLEPADRVLQKTPASFDVSVWEFLWPLMTGATLVLAAPGEHRDPVRLAALIIEQGVTTLHFVPSMLRAFLEHGGASRCTSITRVIASGEALAPELARRCRAELPQASLFNLYGPTEASIDVTHFTCSGSDEIVPIGAPIANTSLHVLDAELNSLPVGATGELYLGGVGLARGYHGRPGLTAERFVPDPAGVVAGARLYRTGDKVRRRRDGQLEYLGRLDQQLKVRGFRVELGEIEAALRALPGVVDAAVSARADTGRDQTLVAYAVFSGSPRSSEELRSELALVLPEHMVPALVMPLATLPLTPSGKLDRKALPAPAWQRAERVEPASELGRVVAGIWQEVLAVPEIGARDDFFALGGHSLLAVQVLSRLREQLGYAPPLRALFEATTVERLALVLETERARQAPESALDTIDSILSELEEP